MSFKDIDLKMAEQRNKQLQLIQNLMVKMAYTRERIFESITTLQESNIIEGVKFMKDVNEFNRFISQLDVILGAPADKKSHNILMYVTNQLERSINPQYPFDFTADFEIKEWLQYYKEAVKLCLGRHQQVWDRTYLQASLKGWSSVSIDDTDVTVSKDDKKKDKKEGVEDTE